MSDNDNHPLDSYFGFINSLSLSLYMNGYVEEGKQLAEAIEAIQNHVVKIEILLEDV